MVTCENTKHPSVYQLDFLLVSPVTFSLAFLTCCPIPEPMGHADLTNSAQLPAERIPLSAHMLLIHQYCYGLDSFPPSLFYCHYLVGIVKREYL